MNISPIGSTDLIQKTYSSPSHAKTITFKDQNSDMFVSQKDSNKKKNDTWKWLLAIAAIAALAVEAFVEHRSSNAAKAEKEIAEKAKNEIEESLKKEKEALEKKVKELENKLTEEVQKLNEILKDRQTSTTEIQSLDVSVIKKELELDKIIGYEKEKDFIINKLILPILEKREKDVPNLLVLYGPKGTGKSFIGDNFAKNPKFNYIELECFLNPKEELVTLENAVKQAEENYKKTGKWNFIRIDEFDSFIDSKDPKILESYKELVENLTKNHSTLITTTNYPKKIDSNILNAKIGEKLYIAPIKKEDLPAFIEHASGGFVEGKIDYEELAQIVLAQQTGNNAYSNVRLKEIIKKKHSEINNIMDLNTPYRLLIQKDLIDAFSKSMPDISKESLDMYKNIF